MVHSTIDRRTLKGKTEAVSLTRTFSYIGLWVLLFLSISALFILLLYKPFFQIEHIKVNGTQALHAYDVGLVAQTMLAKKRLYVIPRDSWITVPQKSLHRLVLETFDRVQDVSLQVKDFDTLVIDIVEWQPSFLWCNTTQNTEIASQDCWFMDREGNIFSKAPIFSPGVYPMFITEASSLDTTLAEKKIDPLVLEEVLNTYYMLEEKNITIETITFGEQYDVTFTLAKLDGVLVHNVELLVDRTMPNTLLQQNLDLLLSHPTFREKFDVHPETLEYIDVRFDGKLLFKFKTPETPIVPVAG